MTRAPALLFGLSLLAALAAGCIQAPAATEGPAPAAVPAGEPLWHNPQTTPHPAFGFPTLTHPATGADAPAWWTPIAPRELPSPVGGMELLAETSGVVPSGAGMSVFGRLAVVPGFGDVTTILDITDPAAPAVLSTIDERHRNVDFIAYPEGRLVAVFSTDAGKVPVYDITDPRNPRHLATMEPATGAHKINVVPGTPIVYNANSAGGGASLVDPSGLTPATAKGRTEIYDLSDPESPVLVQEWKNGYGCHHIYFWNSAEKQRALCAGIEFTQIWDTADPRNPAVIVSIPVHHGVPGTPSLSVPVAGTFAFSHFSILNDDGTVLVVGDEMGGGALPPGCTAPGAPTGAIWFYDVRDETSPTLLGWFSPGQHFTTHRASLSCTAHHGRLVPDAERDLLAMAFYGAGIALIDFTDPRAPVMLDQFNDATDTWEVQYYNGYLFTGDLERGMDVFTFR